MLIYLIIFSALTCIRALQSCAYIVSPLNNTRLLNEYVIPSFDLPPYSLEFALRVTPDCAEGYCIVVNSGDTVVFSRCYSTIGAAEDQTYNILVPSGPLRISNIHTPSYAITEVIYVTIEEKVSLAASKIIGTIAHGNYKVDFHVSRGAYIGDLIQNAMVQDNSDWEVHIGVLTCIAGQVQLVLSYSESHRYDYVSTYPMAIFKHAARKHLAGISCSTDNCPSDLPALQEARPLTPKQRRRQVNIGHDVWIGRGAVIINGVTIGDGAVIGAYSVVRSDVPPYAIVAGNPATVIKYRFEQRIIEELQQIQWWRWSDEELIHIMPWGDDIEAFIDYARNRNKTIVYQE